MKTKRNYSFKKAASAINGIIAETLTDMVRYQNEAIQAGIDNSRDIEGKAFKKLSDKSTLPIRNRHKQGFTPLDTMKLGRKKKLRGLKNIPATKNNLVAKLIMTADYGVYHNEGFDAKGWFKNNPKKVPARNWFGITKDMRADGRRHKNFVKMSMMKMLQSLRKL